MSRLAANPKHRPRPAPLALVRALPTPRTALPALAVVVAIAASAGGVHGAANCVSNRGAPVCTAPGGQAVPAMAPDLTGGYYVLWNDTRSGPPGLFAQHMLPSGRIDPAWPPDGVPIAGPYAATAGIVSDGSGGAIVAWSGSDNIHDLDIHAHHLLSTGALDPGWPTAGVAVCTAAGDQLEVRVVADGAGGALISWMDRRTDPVYDLYASRVLASGLVDPAWPVNGSALCAAAGLQSLRAMVTDGVGGAYVVWDDQRANPAEFDVYAQRVLDYGAIAPGWAADGQPVCASQGDQSGSAAAPDGYGGLLVAWTDTSPGGGTQDIFAQRIESTGLPEPGWPACGVSLVSDPNLQTGAVVLEDGSGGAFVAWADYRTSSIDGDIYAQHVLGSGIADAAWPTNGRAICTVAGDQRMPGMAFDGSGGFIVHWEDFRSGARDVYAQRVSGAGVVHPAWPAQGRGVATGPDHQRFTAIQSDGLGGAYLAWSDDGTTDVHALRVAPDGTLDDPFEPNDACPSAIALDAGAYSALAVATGDDDWFAVTVRRSERLTVNLAFAHASGDVDLRIWDGCGGAMLAASTSVTDNESATYVHLGPLTTVYVQVNLFGSGCNTYDMALTLQGTSNLNAQSTPPGWTGPTVPRNAPGALPGNTQLTPVLDGNLNTTYLNWAIVHEGPNNLPSWDTEVWLDDETLLAYGVVGDDNPPTTYMVGDNGPHTVRGGYHTLLSYADRSDLVPESVETDNYFFAGWIWSPLQLLSRVPGTRSAPPYHVWGGDGFSFTRNSSVAWVVAIASHDPSGDDYDLRVYDDYTGSSSGFSNAIGNSLAANSTDLVVGHFSGTPTTVYPSTGMFALGTGSDYSIVASDALLTNGDLVTGDVQWLYQTMETGEIARVYEARMTSGQTYYFSLRRTSGSSELAFRVFPGTPGGVYGLFDPFAPAGSSSPQGATLDILTYTASVSGWHPIVVYRTDGSNLDYLDYDFHWNRNHLVDVPDRPLELSFAGVHPNPVRETTRFAFTLPVPGDVRLALLDVQGRVVGTLASGPFDAGRHSVRWDGRGESGEPLRAGVYWARLEALGRTFTKRLVVLQ